MLLTVQKYIMLASEQSCTIEKRKVVQMKMVCDIIVTCCTFNQGPCDPFRRMNCIAGDTNMPLVFQRGKKIARRRKQVIE